MSESFPFQLPSPLEQLSDSWLCHHGVQVDVKRDDLIHPIISGNKLRKLSGHIAGLENSPPSKLITMGGMWSNHVHATAYLAHKLALPCTVLLRGPEPKLPNKLVVDLLTWDTDIHYLSRDEYRQLRLAYEVNELESIGYIQDNPDSLFIPEGGYHPQALTGIQELVTELNAEYKAVYVAVGTGTTIAGLAANWPDKKCQFFGIQAVDATASQEQNLQQLGGNMHASVTFDSDYQFGGFARVTDDLIEFMLAIHARTSLITEPVYTGKALFALYDHIENGQYNAGDKVLFIHTGGLQGLRGYQQSGLQHLCHQAGF